ncbi:hypothetical protein EYC80_003401 [Monilinia laxa]|uniref:DUF6590 domain-containing protein n=1 Tax=Monilinia laxa TaxID=61186 RepID=A0A5N6KDS2_MONLA|nr:hypothetical protein EYC80_003401 [Monilinia laxa]
MHSEHKNKGKALDQSTPWTNWIWDDRGYWYQTRTGSTGEQEYYCPSGTEHPSATPRTPGSVGPNFANNSQPILSPQTTTSSNAYTTSQAYNYGATNHDATSTPSYASIAAIDSYYSASNTTNPGYGTIPTVHNSNAAWSSSYAPTDSVSWQHAENIATSSIEDTTRGINSMSLTTPRAPLPNAFGSHVAERLENAKHIYKAPNSGDTETLDSRYKSCGGLRQDDFWKVGRVFMMLWTEPAAQSKVPGDGATSNGSHFCTTFLGQQAYSEIRRFVVVLKGHGSSICCPIHTYSGRATLKPNLPAPNLHTIIYTSLACPDEYGYEVDGYWVFEELTKDPIQVISEREDNEGHLDKLSRLNYSKVYTVEHYVRVLNIGMVASSSMSSLLNDSGWAAIDRSASEHRPRSNHPSKKPPGQPSSHHNKHHKPRKPYKDGHH